MLFAVQVEIGLSKAFLSSFKYVTYHSQGERPRHARRNHRGIMATSVNQEEEAGAFIVVSQERLAETGEAAAMSNLHLSILLDLQSPR